MTVLFRELTEQEEEQFFEFARTHDPDMSQWEMTHPACRKVWRERGFKPQPSDLVEGFAKSLSNAGWIG